MIDTPGKNIPLRPPYELVLVSTSNQRIGKRLANLRAQVRGRGGVRVREGVGAGQEGGLEQQACGHAPIDRSLLLLQDLGINFG